MKLDIFRVKLGRVLAQLLSPGRHGEHQRLGGDWCWFGSILNTYFM